MFIMLATALIANFNKKAEIEDGGGGGTAGSHWEKRVFNNEYMTGSDVEWSVFSPLTLAYFADSGWFQIDDSKAQALIWGKNRVS